MPRVVGIDPGTVSIDVCGMLDGQLYLDRSWPTEEALADPDGFVAHLTQAGLPDLVVGPSGYGLPLIPSAQATDDDLRLAFLAAPDDPGGIGGIRSFARRLGSSGLPVLYVPGVIHLDTVPDHRKVNRVDLGTADKLCAAALGVYDQCERRGCVPEEVSFILVELGGAFTSALAVERGQVVDGIGGTSGPIGWRSAGALDGEIAFLAGKISKADLFQGGVSTLLARTPGRTHGAMRAYIEGLVKAVHQLRCSVPSFDVILLSGRKAAEVEIAGALSAELGDLAPVQHLLGFAATAKQGAQGAALLADGLAGGRQSGLVERLRVRQASGTVLDHLFFITSSTARRRLGLT